MPNPNHGPSCQSWTYPTKCWTCQRAIYVHGCSCGSAVLFDALGGSWPIHDCDSQPTEASLFLTDDEWRLRREKAEFEAIQPGREQWVPCSADQHRGAERVFIGTVEGSPQAGTRRLAALDSANAMELAAMKVSSASKNYLQVTLRDQGQSPQVIYTAIAHRKMAGKLTPNARVGVTLASRGLGSAEWFVVEIVSLVDETG